MEKLNYKISSRTAILLGRENVSKADGAIIELIKNSYDADATQCDLIFNIEDDTIYIIDNGCGMNIDKIKNCWLTIGTDNKKNEYKSNKNRIKSGEKGIGRLSLDRLGNKYELFTKTENDKMLHLETTWSDFEKKSTNLEDIDIIIEESNSSLQNVIEQEKIKNYKTIIDNHGTIIKITQLRDLWPQNELIKIFKMLGYLIPPQEQSDFKILYLDSYENQATIVDSIINEEYDYKIDANFDGKNFNIILYRNEFDINKIPSKIFEEAPFLKNPYRKKDFINKKIEYKCSIEELLNTNNKEKIRKIEDIGKFSFNYIFMKVIATEKDINNFYYKKIPKNRELWIKENSGIKIYRDGFMVRPYGDNTSSDGYDWIGLDARKAQSPAAITHPGMGWKVRNLQGQGTVSISRIHNNKILDKSSREGIIDNEYFALLKEVLKAIISKFEKDRAYIATNFKKYNEKYNKNEKIKEDSLEIAANILNKKDDIALSNKELDHETLAQAINIYQDEREELISEIKLLRSLSTNGLITTSIVHDLKTINATLVERVYDLKNAIKNKKLELIDLNLESLMCSDEFLKSWISVLINQTKSDRRKRKNEDISEVIDNTITNLGPILDKKNIEIDFNGKDNNICRKIFITDFESIIYNLIINSVESFENSKTTDRKIIISLSHDAKNIYINYKDNGDGIGNKFANPYDIFDFGVTSKYNKNGEKEGTGLGMYIVASTINEYAGEYELIETKDKFEFQFSIPMQEGKR